MFAILDLYIARTLLATTSISLAVLVGLSSLIGFVDQMRYVGRGAYDVTLAAIYVAMGMPREVEQFFPMATLIGGLIGMGALASNSELVVMQAAGRSRLNIVTSAMKSALLMVLFVMAVGEWLAPASETKAKEIRTQAISDGSLFSSDSLVWAKDGERFVSIGEVISRERLRDVSIYQFDKQLQLNLITQAEQADFDGEVWQLLTVSYTYLNPQQVLHKNVESGQWQSTLTPDKLSVVTVKPEALSIRGLLDYINYLKNNSQDPDRYRLALWRKVLQPVSVAVMLLLALSFVFGPLRSVSMGARIILGVLTGFGFHIVNQVFGSLSLVYAIPPVLGALLPSLVFAVIAAALLKRH